LALRKQRPALRCGDFRLVRADDAVLWFERWDETETPTCIFNLGTAAQRVVLDKLPGQCLILEAAEVRDDEIYLHRYGLMVGCRSEFKQAQCFD
jgi:hypothetical protein